MKLGMFCRQERIFIGVLKEEQVIELEQLLAELDLKPKIIFNSMRTFLGEFSDFKLLGKALIKTGISGYSLHEVTILAPVLDPPKVICIGLNYRDHAIESKMEIPEEPIFFNKFASSIIGPNQAIKLPRVSNQVDYEAELAVIIGKGGKYISETEAMNHVAGYTLFNDVSARDLQFRGGQWVKGKALDTFAPMGPFLVTADEIPDPHRLSIKLWVNDRLMQSSNTNQLIFNIPRLISYLSQLFTLEAGDIIATGTPPGVGFARKPPVYLKSGDVVKIEIEGVGELSNPVVADCNT